MATILEALQNLNSVTFGIAYSQVENATVLLEKGYPVNTDIENLLNKHGTLDVESVPQNSDNGRKD